MTTFSFESIGTKWQIDINNKISEQKFSLLKENVFSFLKDFSSTYSRFDENSLVTKISKEFGDFKFPESGRSFFDIYKKLYTISDGLFTPLIGQTLDQAGYDSNYSFIPKDLTSPDKWGVMKYDCPILSTSKPINLDFGACGKGYAIDQIREIILNKRINSFIIDAGGDIFVSNTQNYKIGLENPTNTAQIIGTVYIDNKSICASALNRRSWGKFSHIINPKTLQSPKKITGVWVISKKAVIADALATTLFLIEPEKIEGEFDFEYLILYSNNTIKKSENFKAEIFYN